MRGIRLHPAQPGLGKRKGDKRALAQIFTCRLRVDAHSILVQLTLENYQKHNELDSFLLLKTYTQIHRFWGLR